MRKVTVLICDDHTIVRQGLRAVLEAREGIDVIGEAEDGYQAVQESKRLRPNVALVDLGMPRLNGVEATRQITTDVPSTKVLVLSSYCDHRHLQQAIAAGALGYLIKESAAHELTHAIQEVDKGNAVFSPAVSKLLLQLRQAALLQAAQANPALEVELTAREREVIQLVAEGFATKQIADFLLISKKTADKHRQTVMDKLHIHKVAGLTRYAVAQGIVESNRPPHMVEIEE
jgi:DNA-binding NarL/FixJ family response regulator